MMLGICRYHIYCYYYRSELCSRKDNIIGSNTVVYIEMRYLPIPYYGICSYTRTHKVYYVWIGGTEAVVLLHIRANHKKASIKIPTTTTTTTTPAILVHKHSQHYMHIYIYIYIYIYH